MVFPWTERARLVRRTRVGGQSSRTRPPRPMSSPTAPVRRALKTLFGGAVSKDKVSRVWRKVKAEWDAWNARSLADEPVVRLILDGTARPQGNRNLAAGRPWRARGWSEGLHAVKATGGESSDAWRSVLDDLIGRGLCRPHFPDRCPTRWPIRDRNRGAKPAASAGIRPYRCTINMYLICMCWLRRSAPPKRAVTGRIEDRGAEKTATIDPKFGFIRGIPGFPGPPLPLGVIQ